MDCWGVVGTISSILGIVSFPFGIYELITIKTRVKKAQESMKELLILKDYQNYLIDVLNCRKVYLV